MGSYMTGIHCFSDAFHSTPTRGMYVAIRFDSSFGCICTIILHANHNPCDVAIKTQRAFICVEYLCWFEESATNPNVCEEPIDHEDRFNDRSCNQPF
mmetsp:Transcript_128035/g.221228  ORF Transcript_128035/g.221228 Transcript_128035/m.221228 type:complete len:97 (+) Transcript_128035:807-1097(+)